MRASVLVFALFLVGPLSAATNGSVRGSVHNTRNVPIGGANVAIRLSASNLSETTKTDAEGDFEFQNIPAGQYVVLVAYGDLKAEQAIELFPQSNRILQFRLAPQDVADRGGSGAPIAVLADVSTARSGVRSSASRESTDPQDMLDRIRALEKQVADLAARLTASDSSAMAAKTTGPTGEQATQMIAQANPATSGMQSMSPMATQAAPPDGQRVTVASAPKTVEEQVVDHEKRLTDLESNTVMSIPETRTKRIEVWVDKDGVQYDHAVPGTKRTFVYERERVYRRQTIDEKIEQALSVEASNSVQLGVSAAVMPQGVIQTRGPSAEANGHAYNLASADLFFTARVAQNTMFFADVVGLTGTTADSEVPALTLLNSYTARLVRQNELNLREAWVRSELFSQKLALTAGRLDLTNFFDRNAAANDESSQFLSDALVNNPVLGLLTNGSGVALVYDSKRSVNFKIGFQQSNAEATNLSDSLFSLAEVGYVARPLSLPEGAYRVWGRLDNSTGRNRTAFGVSADQKLTDQFTLFGRYGFGYVVNAFENGSMRFFSAGWQVGKRFVIYPGDTWGVGFSQTGLTSGIARDNLVEGYYNFQLTERLRLSSHVAYLRASRAGTPVVGYFVPGMRLQVSF